MIEILNGLHETIDYGDSMGIRMYRNVEIESYPEHWHTGLEVIMPLINKYHVSTGEERHCLNPGDILIVNAGVLHSMEAQSFGERIILQLDSVLLYSLKGMETMLSMMPPCLCLTETGNPEIYDFVRERMDHIVREYEERKPFCEPVIYALLIEMFVGIGRKVTMAEMSGRKVGNTHATKQKEYMEVLVNVCNYINEHYKENLTLEETARISGFSKFHFTRIFKQYMNMTFYEYLNSKRVKRAEELLCDTEMSITDVAMHSGFSSLSAFNRTFKAANGCSPSGFRNKLW